MVCQDGCRKRYLDEVARSVPRITEEDACRELWNARRSGQLSELPTSTEYRPPKKLRHYDFVLEWAYRHVIDRLVREGHSSKHTTLERILCTPSWRDQFDELVGRLMKNAQAQFAIHDYRMVAMSIRKRTGGKPATPSLFDQPIPVSQAENKLPECPGVYLIESERERVFTGWTDNLRDQFAYMKEAGAGSLMPPWLLDGRAVAKTIAFHTFDSGTRDEHLHSHWRGNLRKSLPLLNLFDDEAA
jgi:hypothetical protein